MALSNAPVVTLVCRAGGAGLVLACNRAVQLAKVVLPGIRHHTLTPPPGGRSCNRVQVQMVALRRLGDVTLPVTWQFRIWDTGSDYSHPSAGDAKASRLRR
jgi:hypothetical protein